MELIEKYLKNIGIKNQIQDISDINTLIKKHLQSLYFCNIPVLLGEEVLLDLDAIFEKMLVRKKGGYCFEHNKLIYEALKYFGFEVLPLFARVLNNQKIDVPKTHRLTLLMHHDEMYLVDAGFSFMSPNSAIKFGKTPTKTLFEREYIIKKRDANNYELVMMRHDGPFILYAFDLSACNEKDFEMGNFYSSKHKNANFVNNLVLSKITDEKICSLKNNSYHEISKESTDVKTINSQEELIALLRDEFDYALSDEQITYLFEKFIKE